MKVLVIGENCTDVFIYGDVKRLSPEAPIPVIEPRHQTTNKGMAENVQLNLTALGVNTELCSNTEEITKTRYVDSSYNYILLRIDNNDSVEKIKLYDLPNLDELSLRSVRALPNASRMGFDWSTCCSMQTCSSS